jgi:hypothetical protein
MHGRGTGPLDASISESMTTLPITTNRFSKTKADSLKSKTETPSQIQLMLRLTRETIWYSSNHQIPTDLISRDGFAKSFYPDLFIQPKLCIMVDGKIHLKAGVARKDKIRDEWLEAHGYVVLHFSNQRVRKDMDAVVSEIRRAMS